MLHWQLKSDKYSARAYTIALWSSSVVYGLFLCLLTLVWRVPSSKVLNISLRRSAARIVLAPSKKVGVTPKAGASCANVTSGAGIKTTKKNTSQPVVKAAARSPKKNITAKKVEPKNKPAAPPKKPAPVKKTNNKPVAKKVEKKIVNKLPEQKKPEAPKKNNELKKTVTEKKPVVPAPKKASPKLKEPDLKAVSEQKKPVNKKDLKMREKPVSAKAKDLPVEPKKVEPLVETPVEKQGPSQVAKPVEEPSEVSVAAQTTVEDAILSLDAQGGALSFGKGVVDRDIEAFVAAIRRVWRLPRGLRSDLKAHVLLELGTQGAVVKVSVVRSSGVVAYDLAARAALHRAQYPAVFWGKKIIIEFGKELSE